MNQRSGMLKDLYDLVGRLLASFRLEFLVVADFDSASRTKLQFSVILVIPQRSSNATQGGCTQYV